MLSNKRKLRRTQKISGWIMFICMLIWLFSVSAFIQFGEENSLTGIALALFLLSVVVASLDILGSLVLQIVLNSRSEGVKAVFWKMIKEFILCAGITALILILSGIQKKTEIQLGMITDSLKVAAIAVACMETVKFWTCKIEMD